MFLFIVTGLIYLCFFATISGAVPGIINYQGKVEVNGQAFGSPTPQTGKFWFAILDGSSVIQWSSDGNPTPVEFEDIEVNQGLYHVVLGNSGIMPPLTAGLFTTDELYLQIWFDDGSTGAQHLTPDQRITSTGFALNSDLLDGYHATEFVQKSGDTVTGPIHVQGVVDSTVNGSTYGMVPRGIIIMWTGTLGTIPAGWQLCDGSNGTPDLTNRFILGVQTGEDPGGIGGSNVMTLTESNMPSHDHDLTVFPNGSHFHEYTDTVRSTSTFTIGLLNRQDVGQSAHSFIERDTYIEYEHYHTGESTIAGAGGAFDNRPAYYMLAYIMKL